MHSTINIGESYVLATYQLPSKHSHSEKIDDSTAVQSSLFVTYSFHPRNHDGQVTVAAPGDGVHTLDLGALHSVSAQTIGPTTTFTCPPATYVQYEAGSGKRRTYVVIESGPDISKQQRRRVVWSWEDDLLDDIRSSVERKIFTVEYEIFQIFAPSELNSDVIILSSDGSLYWTDANLEFRRSWLPSSQRFSLLKTFIIPRLSCPFVQNSDFFADSVLLFCFMTKTSELSLRIFALTQNEELTIVEFQLLSGLTSVIVDMSFNSDGFLSVLTGDGSWHFLRVQISNDERIATLIGEPLRLKALSFISQSDIAPRDISLLALSSSHVLLAGITSSPVPEIVLLIWDIQYSVLLCTDFLAIPSNIGKLTSVKLSLSLVGGGSKQAFLILTPTARDPYQFTKSTSATNASLRSSVFAIPYDVPSCSTLANAIGRGAQGVRWLSDKVSVREFEWTSTKSQHSKDREELLRRLIEAMDDEQPDAASSIFFAWYEKEAVIPVAVVSHNIESGDTDQLDQDVKQESSGHIFGYVFTSRLITAIFYSTPERKLCPPWSILHFLLERNVVSHSMIAGGLLPVLLSYSHWTSISLALHHVIDIPEAEIIRALKVIVTRHRVIVGSADGVDIMEVEQDIPPTLSPFLALCIQYSSSTAAWRVSLRDNFADIEDLNCLLQALENWFAHWAVRDLSLISRENNIKVESKRPDKQLRKKFEKVPALDNLISFLQAILDSSFLALLQFNPAHKSLRKLLGYIDPQVTLNENLELLRGFLEPFARSQTDRACRRRGTDTDLRKRRKHVSEQENAPIGLYQIEELSL